MLPIVLVVRRIRFMHFWMIHSRLFSVIEVFRGIFLESGVFVPVFFLLDKLGLFVDGGLVTQIKQDLLPRFLALFAHLLPIFLVTRCQFAGIVGNSQLFGWCRYG